MRHTTFIVKAVQDLLSEEVTLEDPYSPEVSSEDALVFSEEIERKLERFRDKVELVGDFESFVVLLEKAANEVKLNPAQDLDKIASLFNRFRIEKGMEPL